MIYRYKDLHKLKNNIKGKKSVFVTGCFDLVHKGHLDHLTSAAKLGDVLIVGVLPDKYIRAHKNRNPINSQLERATLINALKPVTHVILTSFIKEKTASIKVLRELRPNIFFYHGTNIYKSLEPELAKNNITLIESHSKKPNSTTRIIKKAQNLNK